MTAHLPFKSISKGKSLLQMDKQTHRQGKNYKLPIYQCRSIEKRNLQKQFPLFPTCFQKNKEMVHIKCKYMITELEGCPSTIIM